MTNPYLQHAIVEHRVFLGAKAKAAEYEHERDEAIRAAIAEGVTMYAIAKELGIPPQYVRRIRDRG
jgi:hypothetical protein